MAESKQPQLKTQDLETLDVTKLTALTPEVVSTIHGPSKYSSHYFHTNTYPILFP